MNRDYGKDRNLSQRFEVRQEQKLSQLQIQMLNIVQSPILELQQLVFQELETNPMLEYLKEEELTENPYEEEEEIEEDRLEEIFDEEIKEFFQSGYTTYYTPSGLDEPIEPQNPYTPTLSEHLKGELRLSTSDREKIEIGEYIIDSLKDNGYLGITIEEICRNFCIKSEKAEEVLSLVQSFEPSGIAARDKREAILIKLKRSSNEFTTEIEIIQKFWDEYKNEDYKKIIRRTKLDEKKVKEAIRNIKKINPTPVMRDYGTVNYVKPNVVVNFSGNKVDISIDESDLPYMRLNTKYMNIVESPESYDRETIFFVNKWMRRAVFFLRSLEMRRNNYRKVMNYIIHKQKKFLKENIMYMKALKLSDIAEVTDLDESTISRYLKDTFIQTPRGVFHAKYLLSGGIEMENGSISTNVIREKIRRLIKNEGDNVLTDGDISSILRNEGINVTRRTVTKYRNQLKISTSGKRKKERDLYE